MAKSKNKKISTATMKKFAREFKKLYSVIDNDSGDPDPALYAMQELHGNDDAITSLFLKIEPHMYGAPSEVAEEAGIDPFIGDLEYIQFLVDWADGNLTGEAKEARDDYEKYVADQKRKREEAEAKVDWSALAHKENLSQGRGQLAKVAGDLKKNELFGVRRHLQELKQVSASDWDSVWVRGPDGSSKSLRRKFPGNPHLWHSEAKRKAYLSAVKAADAELRRGAERAAAKLARALEVWDSDGE